jgi:hypothetical protein
MQRAGIQKKCKLQKNEQETQTMKSTKERIAKDKKERTNTTSRMVLNATQDQERSNSPSTQRK